MIKLLLEIHYLWETDIMKAILKVTWNEQTKSFLSKTESFFYPQFNCSIFTISFFILDNQCLSFEFNIKKQKLLKISLLSLFLIWVAKKFANTILKLKTLKDDIEYIVTLIMLLFCKKVYIVNFSCIWNAKDVQTVIQHKKRSFKTYNQIMKAEEITNF